jgi:hypothetical protein
MGLVARKVLFSIMALSSMLLAQLPESLAENNEQKISDVRLGRSSFNPELGNVVTIEYTLSQPDEVTVRVYDPDSGLIRTLMEEFYQDAGRQELIWHGCDDAGKVVPDEAYTFTIETSSGVVYDPTTSSGGVVGDITDAEFRRDGIVTYRLPEAARVLSRLGVSNGPMLKTLVDWKPRVAGEITEYWDGRDSDKVLNLRDAANFSSLITYVTLPEATVIAYGNQQETYRDYKLGRGKARPKKQERARLPDAEGRLTPQHLMPPIWARAPHVEMIFPEHDNDDQQGTLAVPDVESSIDVRIDVDESDRESLLNDQFEVILYVDNVFFAEAERGYLPLNWQWELHQVPPGDHVLTVNVSSFSGQVGVASRKVRVVRSKQ